MEDFWILTSYFNPARFETKRENYLRFRKSLLGLGANLLTLEQVVHDTPELSEFPEVLPLRGGAVLWQKERLLNLGLSKLPKNCKFVAWLDSDIIFDNTNWISEAKVKLREVPILQPFSTVYRLPKDVLQCIPSGESWESFGSVYRGNPNLFLEGDFQKHGHSGFAWVARREILNHGLYDACILGSGDHMMAHAFAGDWESPCVVRIMGRYGKYLAHFQKWASLVYSGTRGRMDFVSGNIFHFWHGDPENRKYVSRNKKLLDFQFDPEKDIAVGKKGLWEWNSTKPSMHRWCLDYFAQRKEDE